MKIYQLLEEANQDLKSITDLMRWHINQEFTTEEWVRATEYFLRGIHNQHQLTGKLVFQLRDICWEYRKGSGMTPSQSLFLSNNLVDHWNQISYEFRSYATM